MKQLKRITALMLAFALVFLLCGCNVLEELRRNQAFYDGEKILRDGAVYLPLPQCDLLRPEEDYEESVFVTENDVPVLLSMFLAENILMPSVDDVFLVGVGYDAETIYCREDMYDTIVERIRGEFTPEKVCYRYDLYNEDSYEFEEKTYTLTQDQIDAIRLITSTVEPQTMGEGWSLDCDWYLPLEECSADGLFRREGLEVAFTGKNYYLSLYMDTQTLAFAVPEGCNALFEEMTKAYVDSWNELWAEEENFF